MSVYDFERLTGLYLNGEWLQRHDTLAVYHKYSGEVVAEVSVATADDVAYAVETAEQAFRTNPMSANRRAEILLNASKLIREHKDEIALVLCRESGKPLRDALAEVDRATETFTLSAEEGKRIQGTTIPFDASPGQGGHVGFTIRVPIGVIGAITPFNYPLNLVAHKVAPAIAAGNAVVLKPASYTPLSAVVLCEVLRQAGLPQGYLNLVIGPGNVVGDMLVKHRNIRMLTFTGSLPVGQKIKRDSGIKKVTLELGNNSPNIVHRDADIEEAAKVLTTRAYAQAGQSCISVQRIYVHADVYDQFVTTMTKTVNNLKVGDPESMQTDVGPLISEDEARRVEAWIEEAVAAGGKVIAGGKRIGPVVTPTLLENVTPSMKVLCQEIFGPVASIVKYNTFAEAVELANDSVYGLQAGVFTKDIEIAWRAIRELDYGGVIINDASSFRADLMPYGGVKDSGIGREGPKYAIEEMTEIRNAIFRLS